MRASRVVSVVLIAAATWLEGCDDATEPQPPVTTPQPSLTVLVTPISATSLAGTVGIAVEPSPSVRVTDKRDRPLAGVTITFKVTSGGGAVEGETVTTGTDGTAVLGKWRLGPTPGPQILTAGAGGEAEVTFTAQASVGPVAQITQVSGNDQLVGVGQALEQPLVVRAADAFGNPAPGVPIVFTVTSGGGTIDGAAVATDSTGRAAAAQWRLGTEPGVQQVRAASGSAQAQFRAFAAPVPGALAGKIAFVSRGGSDIDIAVVNADGTGFTRLGHPGRDIQPAWSPDGSRIAFASDAAVGGTNAERIWVMSADGANASWLTDDVSDYSPAWSPDGRAIAFWSYGDFSSVLVSLTLSDRRISTLVQAAGDAQPSWSPDGLLLAFAATLPSGGKEIYKAYADGGGVTRLTAAMDAFHPAWSPDGSMIAFMRRDWDHAEFRVAVMAADGVFLKDLAPAGPIDPEAEEPGSLAWSPDGSVIAFSAYGCEASAGPCIWSVKYVSLDGSRHGTVVNNAQSPSWRR